MAGPKSIKRYKNYMLECIWNDGFRAIITLENFRKECPCADCRKEKPKDEQFGMQMLATFTPGKNELKQLNTAGNYALTPVWGDGHDSGIYTWENLRDICEKHKLSEVEIIELEEKYSGKNQK